MCARTYVSVWTMHMYGVYARVLVGMYTCMHLWEYVCVCALVCTCVHVRVQTQ